MTVLNDILQLLPSKEVRGDLHAEIKDLCIDSRKVSQGSLFIAIRGTATDGHQYIEKAIELGAIAIVCEALPIHLHDQVTYIVVKDSSAAAGLIAAAWHGHPSAGMRVVGVTGTNGKTTVATLLFKLFSSLGYTCGLISTVENHIGDRVVPSTHTTPDPVSIQTLLSEMQQAGCDFVFMEVSSHAVHQHRIAGIEFAGGIFTNITHDHLDYHKTFDEYIRVKKQFFDNLTDKAFALTNADDRRGLVMLQNSPAVKNTYSLKMPATFKGKVLENSLTGLVMIVDSQEAHFRMIGTFNAYNLLAVYGAALLLGQDKLHVLAALSNLQGAPGRFETVMSAGDRILGIVDYAHTPDALLNVLATINQLRTDGQQLTTIIGCGGDRDKSKRPLMAEAAAEHSDRLILTADNPRTEDPEMILNDMEQGLSSAKRRKTLRISDRKEAIRTACMLSQPGDIILVAGKGHETYQEIKGVRHSFDDRQVLREAFEQLNK